MRFRPFSGKLAADAFWEQVGVDLSTLSARTAAPGFKALTLDNLAHLTDDPWYEPEVRNRIASPQAPSGGPPEIRPGVGHGNRYGLRVESGCGRAPSFRAILQVSPCLSIVAEGLCTSGAG